MGKQTNQDVSSQVEALTVEIKRLKEDIDESYYRIPKQEFENVSLNRVSHDVFEQVKKKLDFWRSVLLIFISVISIFGLSQYFRFSGDFEKFTEEFKGNIQKNLKEMQEAQNEKYKSLTNFKELSEKMELRTNDLVKAISKSQINFESRQNDEIKRLIKEEVNRIENRIENSVTEEVIRIEQSIKAEILRAFEDLQTINVEAQKASLKLEYFLLNSVVEDKANFIEASTELENLILEKSKYFTDSDSLRGEFNSLFEWKFKANKYSDMYELRSQFEDKFEFENITWGNIIIGSLYEYEEFYINEYKERTLDTIEKAKQVLPDYGLPHAARLLIHMIDFENGNDEETKILEKKQALNLLNARNSARNVVTSFEMYRFLLRQQPDIYIKKYVNLLFNTFPAEIEIMKQRYEQYQEGLNTNTK